MKIPFCGGTYFAKFGKFSNQRCVNFYPELDSGGAKDKIALYGTPGLNLAFTTPNGAPVNAQNVFNGVHYLVAGDTLYSRSADGPITGVHKGIVPSNHPTYMSDNGINSQGIGGDQLIIVNGGTAGYIYNVTTGVLSAAGFANDIGNVTFIDGYFIGSDTDGMTVYASDLENGTIYSSLAYSPVEGAPDKIKSLQNVQNQLFIIKEYTSELWADAAVPTSQGFPFMRIPGGVFDFGTPCGASIVRAGSSIFGLGNMRTASGPQFGGVFEITGFVPKIISPPDITYQIQQFSDISDAFAFVQSANGHIFIWFTFPTGNATFVYDLMTKMWHERSTANTTAYQFNRHVAQSYCDYNGKHYVSDPVNGNVYEMSDQYLTDFGNPIISVRRAPVLFESANMNMATIPRLRIDCETGVGTLAPNHPAICRAVVLAGAINNIIVDDPGSDYIDPPQITLSGDAGIGAILTPVIANGQLSSVTVTNGGSGYTNPNVNVSGPIVEPTAALTWSDDGGATWSSDYLRDLGNIGKRETILEYRQLGKIQPGRIFQIAISDPVKKAIFGAYVHG